MNKKTIKKKNKKVLQGRIRSLEGLISLRKEWLNKEVNQARSTYKVIKKDTAQKEEELRVLQDRYNKLINPKTMNYDTKS